MRTLFFMIFLMIVVVSCNDNKSTSKDINNDNNVQSVSSAINKDSLLFELSNQILTFIKDKNYKKISEYVHPTLGVRFSPYAFVDTTLNVKLTAVSLMEQIQKQNKLTWGNFDGSGDSIRLTIQEYFNRFVYNADFVNAEKRSHNKVIGKGNTISNLENIYKDCDFTESYFPELDKKFEGMDWCSLRLVFKKFNNQYYLVGIVHDQWTI
jgi:hypothetical protein